MEAQPQPLTPEDQLGAIQEFIDTTATITAEQLYCSYFTELFNPEQAARDKERILATVTENLQTLNNFCSITQPNLQISHEKLKHPVQIVTFLGFDLSTITYNIGTINREKQHAIWQLTSAAEIQLARQ